MVYEIPAFSEFGIIVPIVCLSTICSCCFLLSIIDWNSIKSEPISSGDVDWTSEVLAYI